jgi:predicted AlkP superfamily pyrophosphatase or phosphodiesterase
MQTFWRYLGGAVTLFGVTCVTAWVISTSKPEPVKAIDLSGKPKLVVLVVFDQMRGDYLKKWQPLFGEGGFKRLQTEGAWYTNCHYPYAYTLTAAGHTSLVTGTSPYKHGIIANEWWDRKYGENVQSTTPPPADRDRTIAGPHRRKSETVGDSLLNTLMGKARVASLSIKERAAILMAALRAQLCYWFDTGNGRFRTSPYYRPDPHSWVNAFNKGKPAEGKPADRWLGKSWDRYNPDEQFYLKHAGPDDVPTEGTGYLQGQTFPHLFQYGKTKKEKDNVQNYYDAVTNSPMGSELLLDFAKTAIVTEKLGQGDSVDLLCISFTSNDYIGHTWGPDSQEVLDITLRSDALMKELLDFLDARVGKGNYYLAMSADHGVAPLVEVAQEQGKEAKRVDPELLASKAEDFLNKKYLPEGKKAPWLQPLKRPSAWIYLNPATLEEQKLKQADVERALANWYDAQPGVEKAFTRTEVMATAAKDTSKLSDMVRRSFHPDCSGDVMVILKPYHMFSPPNLAENPEKNTSYRATHGTPHSYDTHVPLLVMGPRIQAGVHDERIVPQTMASILSEALGVPRPKDAEYPTPDGLFQK